MSRSPDPALVLQGEVPMELRISLFRHLEKLTEEVGCPKPGVVMKGCDKFVISLDVSNIPLPTLSVLPKEQQLFTGDDPNNSTSAEYKAVISVKNFLEDSFSLQIHDLSHSKIHSLQLKFLAHISSLIKSSSSRLHSCMKQYQAAINLLSPFLSHYSKNSSSIFTAIMKSFTDLINVAKSSNGLIEDQLLILDSEISVYCCSVASIKSNNTFKPHPVVCQIFVKDFLADILDCFELPPASFIVDKTDEGLYIGNCSFSLINHIESIKIRGDKILHRISPLDFYFCTGFIPLLDFYFVQDLSHYSLDFYFCLGFCFSYGSKFFLQSG